MKRRHSSSTITDREKKRRKRGIRSLAFWTFSIISFCVFLSFFFNLPIWRIDQIAVEGLHAIPESEIQKIIDPLRGEHIFLVPLGKFKRKIERFPPVYRASLHRFLPNRLRIHIVERKPQAVVVIAGNSLLMDADGILLTRHFPVGWYRQVALENLPVVRGISPDALQGDALSPRYVETVQKILPRLLSFLSASRFQLNLRSLGEVMIDVEDLVRVKLGSAEQLPEKMEILQSAWVALGSRVQQLEYIDLRLPDQPVIKFKS